MAPWQVPAAIAEEAHYLARVFAHPVAALQKWLDMPACQMPPDGVQGLTGFSACWLEDSQLFGCCTD